MLIERM
jgi:hypothetical protein